jgi:transcriptional regulator of acetoin/glycerol metabolism
VVEPAEEQKRTGSARAGTRQAAERTRRAGVPRVEFGDAELAGQFSLGERMIERGIAVLVHGETGSGKEVLANALHATSSRHRGPFVAVNCASLPEHLIESELFGYRAGAFTGAQREGRRGKILQADGGTLFLDEIGDMPLTLQARLLRVLEEREVTQLGSETVIKVDFQLVSASHRDLGELVRTGQFREDLYYRLNGAALHIPPLRERKDKLALIRHLLEEDAPDGAPSLSPEARHALLECAWPGNIRQLRNVLRMAAALCDGPVLTCEHLPADIVHGSAERPPPPEHGTRQASTEVQMEADDACPASAPALNAILQSERETLLALLEKHRWNVSQVAITLGVTRNTLYRKKKRVHIKP